jgi:hypothetical protein
MTSTDDTERADLAQAHARSERRWAAAVAFLGTAFSLMILGGFVPRDPDALSCMLRGGAWDAAGMFMDSYTGICLFECRHDDYGRTWHCRVLTRDSL